MASGGAVGGNPIDAWMSRSAYSTTVPFLLLESTRPIVGASTVWLRTRSSTATRWKLSFTVRLVAFNSTSHAA